jgi:predicted phosphoribosyltransferase
VVHGRYFDLVPDDYVREEVRAEQEILRKRRAQYTQAHPAIDPKRRVVIIVDDGLATGASMLAAVRLVRAKDPAKLVVAVAVAPPSSLESVRAEADEVVCLYTTERFDAVGQFFDDFSQVSDEEVVEALSPSL